MAESAKWICDKCRSERLRLLEEKLLNAVIQIDYVARKNEKLEEQLRLATAGREAGRRDTVLADGSGAECLALGDSIIRNAGCE